MNLKFVCEKKKIPKVKQWFNRRMRHLKVLAVTRTVSSRSTRFPWQRVPAAIRVVPERAARNLCGVRPAIQVCEVINSLDKNVVMISGSFGVSFGCPV